MVQSLLPAISKVRLLYLIGTANKNDINNILVKANGDNKGKFVRSFVVPGTDQIVYDNGLQGHRMDKYKGGHMNRLKINLRKVDLAENEIWIESMFDACPVFHVSIDGFCYPKTRFGFLKSFEIDDELDRTLPSIKGAPEFLLTFNLKLDAKDTFSAETILNGSLFEDTEFNMILEVSDAGEYVQLLIRNPNDDHHRDKRVEQTGRKKRDGLSKSATSDSGTSDTGDSVDFAEEKKSTNTGSTIRTTDALSSEFKQLSTQSLTIFNPRERLDTSLASKVQSYSLAFTKAEIDVENGANNLLYDVAFGYNNMILSKFLWTSPKAKG